MFYAVEHEARADILRQYEGMPQDAIEAILAESGNAFDFIEKDAFEARMAAAQKARADVKPVPEKQREAAYRGESDALVIRAVRLQMAGDPGFDAAKAEALAKVAEIKARYPDKGK
tara:strand:- start:1217 stop:1564 length:348 start_codon:yes stop_codon:yes gene_type:complete